MTATTELVVPRSIPMIFDAMIAVSQSFPERARTSAFDRRRANRLGQAQLSYLENLPLWRKKA
jgi:hypothetical protein